MSQFIKKIKIVKVIGITDITEINLFINYTECLLYSKNFLFKRTILEQGGQNMLKNQQNADFLKNFFPSFSVFPS
jgi:hypothetical protein